jgi:hypothetical protein
VKRPLKVHSQAVAGSPVITEVSWRQRSEKARPLMRPEMLASSARTVLLQRPPDWMSTPVIWKNSSTPGEVADRSMASCTRERSPLTVALPR